MRYAKALFSTALLLSTPLLNAQVDSTTKQLAHSILKQLIEINTTDSVGNVTIAAEAMAERFRQAGFPAEDIAVLGPNDRKKNLVVRYHGAGAHKPLLLLGHLDVVEALRQDWSTDPFQLVEKEGYFYGRGTQDMKGEDALLVTTLLRFKQEGYKPERDIILALTADEEGGRSNGVDWLIQKHHDLVDAEYVVNSDGGGPVVRDGKTFAVEIEASEKAYADYRLTALNPGGHSSLPVADNAIYHIVDALAKVQKYQFPFELNPVTRAYFERTSSLNSGERAADIKAILQTPPDDAAVQRLSKDPLVNSILRTTCVATRLDAGHANNALPQTAHANINCRIFPGHTREQIRQQLIQLFGDPKVSIEYVADNGDNGPHAPNTGSLAPQALRPDFLAAVQEVAGRFFPKTSVVPVMAAGASDGIYTNAAGMPTYDVSSIPIDDNDVRAHGKDERIRVTSYDQGVEVKYALIKALTSK